MLWHLLIVHFRKLIKFGFKFGCRQGLQLPLKKLTWLRARLHLDYFASTFLVPRFLFFFFLARMNSNCTAHAHGFTVQELHLGYCASTFLVSLFIFFFFFLFPLHMNSHCIVHAHGFTVQKTKCTVHGTYTQYVQKKKY